jgi:hypothetical protein
VIAIEITAMTLNLVSDIGPAAWETWTAPILPRSKRDGRGKRVGFGGDDGVCVQMLAGGCISTTSPKLGRK